MLFILSLLSKNATTTIVDQKFFTYGYFYNQLQTNVKIQYMFKWHMF